jgi:hypothetical protein
MTFDVMSTNTMGRATHPPPLPQLASCDFRLFVYVRESRAGKEFASWEEFLEAATGILEGIETVTLEQVFLGWMERLVQCIAANGDSVESIFVYVNRIPATHPVLRCLRVCGRSVFLNGE